MILIADGGSTKVDWVALDNSKKELFRSRSLGLNPAILTTEALSNRIFSTSEIIKDKESVMQLYFYGAGCGTPVAVEKLQTVLEAIYPHADVLVQEDTMAAIYAASGGAASIVCILGTGSNSSYFDGKKAVSNAISLGYLIMDEASGNYYGKKLLRDFYYKKMPKEIAERFDKSFDLSADEIKHNLYQMENPNAYLGNFATFMFECTENPYIHNLIEKGFSEFFEFRILPYKKAKEVPIYFIGSIAYYFAPLLHEVAQKYNLKIKGILQRPIDNLIAYHANKAK